MYNITKDKASYIPVLQTENQFYDKHFVFFLPAGGDLGGVTTWVYQMVSYLNSVQSGSASILSFLIKGTDNQFPDEVKPYVREVVFEGESKEEKIASIDFLINSLKDVYPPNTILIPNYTEYAYAVAVGIKNGYHGKCDIWAILHSDEAHYYDLANFYSNFISRFVCVSAEIEQCLKNLIPERERDIFKRPYGLTLDKECFVEIGQKFQKMDPLIITYVGRVLRYQKRFQDILIFLSLLDKSKINYKLNIVGDGKEFSFFSEKLQKYVSSGRVVLHGRIPQEKVKKILSETHIYISFSSFEGTSLALLEAMNCGTIPVITDVSGVRAVLSDSKESFVYSVGDIKKAVAYIQKIQNFNREKLAAIAKSNFEISQKYHIDDYIVWFLEQSDLSDKTEISLARSLLRNWDEWRLGNRLQIPYLTIRARKIRNSWIYVVILYPVRKIFRKLLKVIKI